jgi:hypothetical protein
VRKTLWRRALEKGGAPEEIRTPDPQIRSFLRAVLPGS